MPDEPQQKPLVGQIDAHDGSKVVVAGTIVGDVYLANKPTVTPDQRNRLAMLQRVRSDWIDGVLNQSLYRVARIELSLQAKDDAVELPLNAIVQVPDRAPTVIPPGTGIVEVFDKLGQALLILGAPGTGKTTLLLELAEALLDRALKDDSHPIPVVFNLSTWAVKREPLTKWLVSELKLRYGVSKKLAQRWVENGDILALLDGLDEVDGGHRPACLDAINQFRSEWGLLPIAVCSRIGDFEGLRGKLRLNGAVVVQQLTISQVDDYIARTTELTSLRATLKEDSSLIGLLETPLMLWVAMLAYRDTAVTIVKGEGLEEKRRRLLASFVDAMFKRRAIELLHPEDITIHWLSWLASNLNRYKQAIFYLEGLGPNWLRTNKQLWLFKAATAAAGLTTAAVAALGILLISWLLGWSWSRFLTPLSVALSLGPGLVVSLLTTEADKPSHIHFRFSDVGTLTLATLWVPFWLLIGWLSAWPVSLISQVAFHHHTVLLRDVQAVTLAIGLLIGLTGAMIILFTSEQYGPSQGTPNQGAQDSTKAALVLLLVSWLLVALISGWASRHIAWIAEATGYGLLGGWVCGLICALIGGGEFSIRHFALRSVLWATKSAPLNYVAFLDYATDRLFLRKVGGGYIFTHRMLLEYFASLSEQK